MKQSIVIITNLYPLPWQPTRATFNFQQFSLLAQEYDVHILIPVAFPDWLKHRKQIKPESNIKIVPYVYLPKFGRRFYSTLMYWSLKFTAWSWLKKINPTKLLASWAYPDGVAAQKLATDLNCHFYLKVHGSDINIHATFPARSKQIVKMANHANGILSVSKDLAKKMTYLGVKEEKIEVIYNGVNLDKFTPTQNIKTHTPYILFIGNLKKEKGVIELLQAFKIINDKYPQLRLKYIGSGSMLSQLQSISKQLCLESKVDFEGVKPHDELPCWLGNATLLALPSYNEGVPNVVLESMACGVPVVASAVGGIPEVVTKNTGCLAKEITPESIATQLELSLNSTWDKTKIRAHAMQFNWANNIQKLALLLSREK